MRTMAKAVPSTGEPSQLLEFWRRLYPDTVLDALADGVFLVDATGRIVFWNRGAERITGFAQDEVQGRICSFLRGWIWHPEPGEGSVGGGGERSGVSGGSEGASIGAGAAVLSPCCALFDLGTIDSQECEITRKDGTVARIVRSARLLKDDDGRVVGGIHNFSDLTRLRTLEARLDEAERERTYRSGLGGLVGRSPQMQQLFALLDRVAPTDATVVIEGESGTGKELVARALHERSARAGEPFVAVNVAALPPALLESELFGHVRGAFTGAVQDREGRFELASGGTLFLDEIGDLPLELQPKLLRALQERTIERIGDARPRKVDVRVVAATHFDLKEQVRQGRFREDLFFRLAVFTVKIPPLRDRKEDIPLLVRHFLQRLAAGVGKTSPKAAGRGVITGRRSSPEALEPEALRLVLDYCWPGNVRELENAVEHAAILARGPRIGVWDLPEDLRRAQLCDLGKRAALSQSGVEQTERARIEETLRVAGGSRTRAAAMLGITRSALWKRMKRLGMQKVRREEG
jgi:transcriptional regulator with PAS, ATPase and Fis domain